MFCFQNEGEEEEENYQEGFLRIRRGRPMEIMPTIMEVEEDGTKEEDVTSKVRLNLTPFVLHTR